MRFFELGVALSPPAENGVANRPFVNGCSDKLVPGCLHSTQSKPVRDESAVVRLGKTAKAERERKSRIDGYSLAPEPLNYLRLRRTEESKAALRRNREASASVSMAAKEIISPSLSPTRKTGAATSNNPDRTVCNRDRRLLGAEIEFPPDSSPVLVLASPSPTVPPTLAPSPKTRKASGSIKSDLEKKVNRLREQKAREEENAARAHDQVQSLLKELRRAQLARMAPPLLQVYTRHKMSSRWLAWLEFVVWHREECVQLQQLAPFIVRIQRIYRIKRLSKTTSLEALRRSRLVIFHNQWVAVQAIQRITRRWLRRREQYRQRLTRYASRLQAIWKGRHERQGFRRSLKLMIRELLVQLAPAGSIYRLHDLTASDPTIAKTVNYVLTLMTETPVVVDRERREVSHKHYQPLPPKIEVSCAKLVHSVIVLQDLLVKRQHAIENSKLEFIETRSAVQAERQANEREAKYRELFATNERIRLARDRHDMTVAERETQEYVRALRFVDIDAQRRAILRAQRREQQECLCMREEEIQTRYVVAENARRESETLAKEREFRRRAQLVQAQRDREGAIRRAILEQSDQKQRELAQCRKEADDRDRMIWSELSLELKQDIVNRQQAALLSSEHDSSDGEEDVEAKLKLRLELQRKAKLGELEQERSERVLMAAADAQSRQWYYLKKKQAHAEDWLAKRERERLRFAVDPLQYERAQAQLEQEEFRRRENYNMRLEDERAQLIHERQKKELAAERAREQTRNRLLAQRHEKRERELMEIEEQHEVERIVVQKRTDEYHRLLHDMKLKSETLTKKQQEQISEARSRREMRDEELRQQRVAHAEIVAVASRESRERLAMEREDAFSDEHRVRLVKNERRRRQEQLTLKMMREDVESMNREDWEREGIRLETFLWTPFESAALALCAEQHLEFLYENVRVFLELAGGVAGLAPPLELDFENVRANSEREHLMSEEEVLVKKRKPRKFFYHEFFEEDPILGPLLNRETEQLDYDKRKLEEKISTAKEKARGRWRKLSEKYLPQTRSSEEHLILTRRGLALMCEKKFELAHSALSAAIFATTAAQCPHPSLVRQLGRCNVALFEHYGRSHFANGALLRFHQAASHVWLVGNPKFLQEIARALELAGKARESAETLAAIIRGFPRYSQISEIVFRAGVVLCSLHEFRQSREYLLHVLDDEPFGWRAADILFMVARVLQREGDPAARRLSALAFEEAFRKKRDAGDLAISRFRGSSTSQVSTKCKYSTWQEFVKSIDTWRRVGDNYFEKKEFALARDAYNVMVKRTQKQCEGPSELVRKRRAVATAVLQNETLTRNATSYKPHHTNPSGNQENNEESDQDDWLRMAKAYTVAQNREKARASVSRWLEIARYSRRVRDRYLQWPLARWKLLTGHAAPAAVLEAHQQHDSRRHLHTHRINSVKEAWGDTKLAG